MKCHNLLSDKALRAFCVNALFPLLGSLQGANRRLEPALLQEE
jgi:hypothetical protein